MQKKSKKFETYIGQITGNRKHKGKYQLDTKKWLKIFIIQGNY